MHICFHDGDARKKKTKLSTDTQIERPMHKIKIKLTHKHKTGKSIGTTTASNPTILRDMQWTSSAVERSR